MQLVGHAPYGARVNRALGLALRKRFCVTFDFELQAAASDDAILLSLGPQHSFPLERVPKFLASKTVEQVVRQAVLTSPMFPARWRWNLNTSLTVLRMRGGRKNPPAIQRMEADDLMAAVFPTLAACQENVAPGPIEIPDHPLVRQTLEDCLHEAMDIDGLRELVAGIEAGRITVIMRDTTEPSVLAHEILNGRPFTYLDDAPAGSGAAGRCTLPRGLPVEARDLARLDPAAIERVREQVRPQVRDADELHDLLMTLFVLRPQPEWGALFAELAAAGRAAEVPRRGGELWCAVERRPRLPRPVPRPDGDRRDGPAVPRASRWTPERSPPRCSAGTWSVRGPSTVADLAQATALGGADVALALIRLENEGFALHGHFTDPDGAEEYCARRVLARIHAYTRERKRREIEPVTARDFMRFLLRWQHVTAGHPAGGQPRRARRGRAAAGVRAGRRGLGEGRPGGPGGRLPQGVAGRGVPGRRRRLGPAVGPRRAGRAAPARRADPVPGDPDHADDPGRPAVAAAGGPRRAPARRAGTGPHQRRARRAGGSAARCSSPTWSR